MKRLRSCFILLALAALCLAAPRGSSAVDLMAGWYAQIGSVSVYALDVNNNPYLYGGGWFYSDLGTYGPFTVTADPGGNPQYARTVTVLNDAYGITPGTSVELPIGALPERIAYISVGWHTNYDASMMQLQFLRRDPATGVVTTLWQQSTSGDVGGWDYMAYGVDSSGIYPDGLFFRVAVLPEPSGLSALVASSLTMILAVMRRRSAS